MLRDYNAGEHMLLMGNQEWERTNLRISCSCYCTEKESTFSCTRYNNWVPHPLTVLERWSVRFQDSPLVKAMIHGRVLVIDEFDKAPTEVVIVLKSLLEDGEILLADGRRFVQHSSPTREWLLVPQP